MRGDAVTAIPATWFDGHSSAPRAVRVRIEGTGPAARLDLYAAAPGADVASLASIELGALEIGERVGRAARHVRLPDGGTLEIAEHEPFERALRDAGLAVPGATVHRLERVWGMALLALVVAVVATWAALRFASPALAARVADALPASVDAKLGEGGLALLDRRAFGPSELSERRRRELRAALATVTSGAPRQGTYRLEFRVCGPIGANAFALPSGIVVLCDELVALASHDDELRAVLAHEVGHLVHRHSTRMIVQSSIVALVVGGILGDVSGASSLVVAVPTVLLNDGYSREFEREADAYAYRWLDANDVGRHRLADILAKLAAAHGGGDGGWFSTHPDTEERRRAATEVDPPNR